MLNKSKLYDFINNSLKTNTILKRSVGQVFTSIDFIDKMYNSLENHCPDIFRNPNYTFFDPTAGLGNYPIVLYFRLMDGLKNNIPDEQLRHDHILNDMIYCAELLPFNCSIIKNLFNNQINLYHGDSLKLQFNNPFTCIIGNPPYQKEFTRGGALPLYNEFFDYYINKCKFLSFVIPSRWMTGGKGLDKFRKCMMLRQDLVYINHFNNASDIFHNVAIKGGIQYILKDSDYNGDCIYNGVAVDLSKSFLKYGIFIYPDLHPLIDHLTSYIGLNTIMYNYNIQTNDKRMSLIQKENMIKCYTSQHNGSLQYIDSNNLKFDYKFYKVIIATVPFNDRLRDVKLIEFDAVCSNSYLCFIVESESEGVSLISYLNTKFVFDTLMLFHTSIKLTRSYFRFIPLVPLNRIWDEKAVRNFLMIN
jgi:site-specific DNA-methyltransferase (adenine-specific)